MNKIIEWIKSDKSDFVFFVIAVVLFNIVIFNAHLRLDITKERTYTLSEASRAALKSLHSPLSVKVFFSKDLPTTYNGVSQFIRDILVEYKGVDSKNFDYTIFDMSKPESVKAASTLGAQQVQIQQMENNEVKLKQIWMSIALVYGDTIDVMNAVTSEQGFEYTLTTKIAKLVSTGDALAAMDDNNKIDLTFYKSEELSQFGINGFSSIEGTIKDAFEAANKKSLGRVAYKKAPVSSTSEAGVSELESIADQYGLQLFSWEGKDGAVGRGIFGLVLSYQGNFRTIPLTIERGLFGYGVSGTDTLEENISTSVQSLLSSVSEVGYATGHEEADLFTEKGEQSNFTKLLADMYEMKKVILNSDPIPQNIQSIIINGPKSAFNDVELYKLDQFVMRGGNLIIFADPYKMEQGDYFNPSTFTPIDNNLNRILTTYGITQSGAYVFDENCYTAKQRRGNDVESYSLYWAPMLAANCLNQAHPITKNLGYVIFLQPGLFALKDSKNAALGQKTLDGVRMTTLAVTSPASWTQSQNIQLTPNIGVPYDKTTEAPNALAVLLEGKFPSAYTEEVNKKTAELDEKTKSEAADKGDSYFTSTTHLARGIKTAKIFFAPTSFITSDQLIDAAGSEPVAIFIRNVVDYLNGNENLCSMRTKGVSFKTLELNKGSFVTFIEWFSIVGLAILTVIVALLVLRARSAHRCAILKTFNPHDERILASKKQKAVRGANKKSTLTVADNTKTSSNNSSENKESENDKA